MNVAVHVHALYAPSGGALVNGHTTSTMACYAWRFIMGESFKCVRTHVYLRQYVFLHIVDSFVQFAMEICYEL